MNTGIAKVVIVLVACASGVLIYRGGIVLNWWSPLTRPTGVPVSAQFVFAWESEAWFDCGIDERRNVNPCRAWDNRGRLRAYGDFQLIDEHRAATRAELRPSVLGATNDNGLVDTIYLFGSGGVIEGKQLVRVGSRDFREKSSVTSGGGRPEPLE